MGWYIDCGRFHVFPVYKGGTAENIIQSILSSPHNITERVFSFVVCLLNRRDLGLTKDQ